MGLRLRSNEASRPYARKPSGRQVFCLLPALARSLQPAAGMRRCQSGSDLAALAKAKIPRRSTPCNFQTGSWAARARERLIGALAEHVFAFSPYTTSSGSLPGIPSSTEASLERPRRNRSWMQSTFSIAGNSSRTNQWRGWRQPGRRKISCVRALSKSALMGQRLSRNTPPFSRRSRPGCHEKKTSLPLHARQRYACLRSHERPVLHRHAQMNPVVRHFLPSVVRGVYRADDVFSKIEDERAFKRFVEAKLKFLPERFSTKLRHRLSLDDGFDTAQHQHTLPTSSLPSLMEINERVTSFFKWHSYFENARGSKKNWEQADNFLEIQFVHKILAPLLSKDGLKTIRPQHQIGPYFADFALEGASKFVIEVDGFGKFKDRDNLDDFHKRQNYIMSQGWRVIRFTFSQIMENTAVTLRFLHTLLKEDAKLRGFLTVPWHTGALRNFFTRSARPQVMDVVNDFYRVQDSFVEAVLSAGQSVGPIRLKDGFGLGVPFVALAVSALYAFLEAVQSVVELDFQLPEVTAGGCGPADEWAAELHGLVSASEVGGEDTLSLDPQTVRLQPACLPVPPRGAEDVRFRRGLKLDAIQQGLQYFCSSVFGYRETKRFQNLVLERVFNGQHVLGISATGSGKSFCFWLPALLKPGLTLVICPLRSLMRDQCLTLRNYGIASAEFINSDVDKLTQRRILEEAKLGYIRLLYVSPERLRIKKFVEELEQLQEAVPINFLAVDEAHCISEWGHDFRPSYLKLPLLREMLSEGNDQVQLIALTATAGQQVEKDVLGILKLKDEHVVREHVADRPKFSYQIIAVAAGSNKTKIYHEVLTKHLPKALRQRSLPDLLRVLNTRSEKSLGIVFCIYADPHGKHSIHDGIAHYLYEAMGDLEAGVRFEMAGHIKKYREDAYGTGKVRAFASKTPTLCPECLSYEYTSKSKGVPIPEEDEEEDIDDEEAVAGAQSAGLKVCGNCGHEFHETDAYKPVKWEDLIKANQADFKDDRFDILVATKGFGMGIDKSSVRFVVHTSLSSGLESWYQEVGRAGRDDERAHIVLLLDPPTDSCRAELGTQVIRKPRCNYRNCPHGRDSLCDYGKQHMFITGSYPGPESDAIAALQMLARLIAERTENNDSVVVVNSHPKWMSRHELAIYRLKTLGLVEDYVVEYRPPRFGVEFNLPNSPDDASTLSRLKQRMAKYVEEHLSHYGTRRGRSVEPELERVAKKYQKLEDVGTPAATRFRNSDGFARYAKLFQAVYHYVLLLLDHTYEEVVKMRYRMLWNLQTLATSKKCRRSEILPEFMETLEEGYRCGCCDNCSPELDFLETRIPPKARTSDTEKEAELQQALNSDAFDRSRLIRLKDEFAEYPTSKYRQAVSILEGNASNLSALFLAREFSPPEEYEGNAKALLQVANQKQLPLLDVQELYQSSKPAKSKLLLMLNEADTACDTLQGRKFLAEQAAKPEHHRDAEVVAMRVCLDFILLVEEGLLDETETLKGKARELDSAFSYA